MRLATWLGALLMVGCGGTMLHNQGTLVLMQGGVMGASGDPGSLPDGVIHALLSGPTCPFQFVKPEEWAGHMEHIHKYASPALKAVGNFTVFIGEKPGSIGKSCTIFLKREEKAVYTAYAGSREPHKVDKLPADLFDNEALQVDVNVARAAMGMPGGVPAGQPAKK